MPLDLATIRARGILGLDSATLTALVEECERLQLLEAKARELIASGGGNAWPAFWRSLTDAECAEALRCAPRVAGEWTEDEYEDIDATGAHNRRRIPDGTIVAYYYRDPADDVWPWSYDGESDEGHASARSEQEARSACDAALRAAGWRVRG